MSIENMTLTLNDSSTLEREVLINTTKYEEWIFYLKDGTNYTLNIGIKGE